MARLAKRLSSNHQPSNSQDGKRIKTPSPRVHRGKAAAPRHIQRDSDLIDTPSSSTPSSPSRGLRPKPLVVRKSRLPENYESSPAPQMEGSSAPWSRKFASKYRHTGRQDAAPGPPLPTVHSPTAQLEDDVFEEQPVVIRRPSPVRRARNLQQRATLSKMSTTASEWAQQVENEYEELVPWSRNYQQELADVEQKRSELAFILERMEQIEARLKQIGGPPQRMSSRLDPGDSYDVVRDPFSIEAPSWELTTTNANWFAYTPSQKQSSHRPGDSMSSMETTRSSILFWSPPSASVATPMRILSPTLRVVENRSNGSQSSSLSPARSLQAEMAEATPGKSTIPDTISEPYTSPPRPTRRSVPVSSSYDIWPRDSQTSTVQPNAVYPSRQSLPRRISQPNRDQLHSRSSAMVRTENSSSLLDINRFTEPNTFNGNDRPSRAWRPFVKIFKPLFRSNKEPKTKPAEKPAEKPEEEPRQPQSKRSSLAGLLSRLSTRKSKVPKAPEPQVWRPSSSSARSNADDQLPVEYPERSSHYSYEREDFPLPPTKRHGVPSGHFGYATGLEDADVADVVSARNSRTQQYVSGDYTTRFLPPHIEESAAGSSGREDSVQEQAARMKRPDYNRASSSNSGNVINFSMPRASLEANAAPGYY
ncbi:hypothetical protein B0A50_02376 [Salinomyces thailandicus]|uniref:Uncharacterized protein n=1 Tax=Salinomyces thailandicus TaxID=706561 RepID=A0A4U0U898_9PEZI|nr:hypothetical protein B0A50_02376 [Salinomyces thailandica]